MTSHRSALAPLTATVLGYPRIGRRRELKHALESYWEGRGDESEVREALDGVRRDGWRVMTDAGLDSVPVGTASLYDHVLDTTLLLGLVPERFRQLSAATNREWLDRYSAMARGGDGVAPLEMTKWFDTNYHYLVPEIEPDSSPDLHPDRLLAELGDAVVSGVPARPVLVGPLTFLLLAKAAPNSPSGFTPLDLLDEVVERYAELLPLLAAAGAGWVQFDEPVFVCDRTDEELAALGQAYRRLSAVATRPALLVAGYFGDLGPALGEIAASGVEGVAVDLVAGRHAAPAAMPDLTRLTLVAGLVDGRNVWRTDLTAAADRAAALRGRCARLAVSTSCSLLHVPYDVSVETELPDGLRERLAFADQKVAEVVALAHVVADERTTPPAADGSSCDATAGPSDEPFLAQDDRRGAGPTALGAQESHRAPYEQRRRAQAERLDLPPLPTTTIGSFPQTVEIRAVRARFHRGLLDEAGYVARMREEIARVIAVQERLGLDVLVHGEPERDDMVRYFAEHLDGYAMTRQGWVQSYGTRCVRPPILHGDVSRPAPITVPWATYAQGLTTRPVKGMLTGPVTMLAWSFVRTDQPLAETARRVALAVRDDVRDLEAAGLRIVQVDEPALRELLPLRRADQPAYRTWSVAAFRLATSGAGPATQIHTHLCYSDFDEVLDAIDDLDADVTSVEAARSGMVVVDALARHGLDRGLGPGVYDIHSPRVPDTREVATLLRASRVGIPAERLWVNPDCGLKTRGYDEVVPALAALVAAAQELRTQWAQGPEGSPVPARG